MSGNKKENKGNMRICALFKFKKKQKQKVNLRYCDKMFNCGILVINIIMVIIVITIIADIAIICIIILLIDMHIQ